MPSCTINIKCGGNLKESFKEFPGSVVHFTATIYKTVAKFCARKPILTQKNCDMQLYCGQQY
jgi:hypothetical protein